MTKARTLADNYAADINQVTASAPLTGGGTSGTVTVGIQDGTTSQKGAVQLEDSTASTSTTKASTPNSVKSAYDLANGAIAKSTVDAKGDLLVGTANDTISRLAVASTAGYLLSVDSAEATGLKWAAPAAAGFVGCYAYAPNANNQSINDSTNTVVNLESEAFDTDGFHSTSSNTGRITIPAGKGGKYLVQGQVALRGAITFNPSGVREIYLAKNSTTTFVYTNYPALNSAQNYPSYMQINTVVDLTAGDYIQMMVTHSQGTAISVQGDGYSAGSTFLAVQYLGA